jgi:hypothetical protein
MTEWYSWLMDGFGDNINSPASKTTNSWRILAHHTTKFPTKPWRPINCFVYYCFLFFHSQMLSISKRGNMGLSRGLWLLISSAAR